MYCEYQIYLGRATLARYMYHELPGEATDVCLGPGSTTSAMSIWARIMSVVLDLWLVVSHIDHLSTQSPSHFQHPTFYSNLRIVPIYVPFISECLSYVMTYHQSECLSYVMTYHQCFLNDTMGVTIGVGTVYPSASLEFTPNFSRVCVAQLLAFCVIFCWALFISLIFLFWLVHCLSFYGLRLLIIHLVS